MEIITNLFVLCISFSIVFAFIIALACLIIMLYDIWKESKLRDDITERRKHNDRT